MVSEARRNVFVGAPLDHARLASAELSSSSPDWTTYHAHKAADLLRPAGKVGLIIGCNRGEECETFIGFGAERVIGVDPMSEIGSKFRDPRAVYHRCFAEDLPLPDNSVDFIYSYATFEHVHGLAAAWWEACRVLRPGGAIRTVAAPLWNSQSGPHWGNLFDAMPWAHLRMKPEEILDRCRTADCQNLRALNEHQIRYWLDPRHFNRRFAKDYQRSCTIPSWCVLQNDIYIADNSNAESWILSQLYAAGYDDLELFGGVHELYAEKRD